MAIHFQVLGQPGRDNALFVTVDTGQSLHRLLFDCGESVLTSLSVADVQQIEGLFFSHFHFDHVAGFDSFFRLNWSRLDGPVRIFGPLSVREIIHHRLQGVTWNLVAGLPGEVQVTSLEDDQLVTTAYQTQEGFREERQLGREHFENIIDRAKAFDVLACPLPHGTVSLGYLVRERDRQNIDLDALADLGLKPGPWLQAVKNPAQPETEMVETSIGKKALGELRSRLLVTQPGDSIAYLTDFLLDNEETEERLVTMLKGCRTLVCENNYADADRELAQKNYHMTSSDVGRLAARVQPQQLVLFHLSDRYTPAEWREQLREVRAHFPQADFPTAWQERIA